MRWRPSRYNVQPPMSLTRRDGHEGPMIPRPPPAGTPTPHLIRFPVGPAVLWAECRASAMGSAELSNFGPSIKMMLYPTVRKAVRGRCDGRPRPFNNFTHRASTLFSARPQCTAHSPGRYIADRAADARLARFWSSSTKNPLKPVQNLVLESVEEKQESLLDLSWISPHSQRTTSRSNIRGWVTALTLRLVAPQGRPLVL
jgi:hypothetical protein